MRTSFTLLIFLHSVFAPLFSQPVLVKNIKPGNFSGIQLGAARSAVLGNTLYFTADDDVHGVELWKSDGTAAGTVLVRDIYPGKTFDGPDRFYLVHDGQLYFTARDTTHGMELWRTDEGPEGAVLVRDACPGTCSGVFFSAPGPMTAYQGKLHLKWDDYVYGQECWATDGTEAGSSLLKDLYPGAVYSSAPYGFTVFQDKLYFAADSAELGSELWVSDGTAAGTRLVKNINTSNFGDCEMDAPVVGADAFYFWARKSSGDGRELWKSDGTDAGTVMVKDINPGSSTGMPNGVPLSNSLWLGNRLLFVANDGASGEELWVTDGTEAGTVLVKDIHPGNSKSNIGFLTVLNGQALFRANDGVSGNELWVSDGTEAGTRLFKNLNPGAADGLHFAAADFTVFQNKMIFTANDGVTGREIWITDGTETGTVLFADVAAGPPESNPSNFHVIGNNLFFFAATAATGRELWKYDLTSVATGEPAKSLSAKIYPTLSADGHFLLLTAPDATDATYRVEIFDALGRVHASRTLFAGDRRLDLSALPAGAWFARVHGEETRRSATLRLVISNR